jgi:hypothetical protein
MGQPQKNGFRAGLAWETLRVLREAHMEWITGEDLIKRWDIYGFELLAYIMNKGLTAYGRNLQPCSPFVEQGDLDESSASVPQSQIDEGSIAPDWYYERSSDAFKTSLRNSLDSFYRMTDILALEEAYGISPKSTDEETPSLTGKEKRELGQLRTEKRKWDDSLKAAVQIGIFCAELHSSNKELKKSDFRQEMYEVNPNLPESTQEQIWKSIPSKYKKSDLEDT